MNKYELEVKEFAQNMESRVEDIVIDLMSQRSRDGLKRLNAI